MKYLGVWQRLGVVLTVLATVLQPTLVWLDDVETFETASRQFYDGCLENYPAEQGAFLKERKVCLDAYLNRSVPDYVEYMKEGIPFAFAFCLVIWLLAYATYFVARWVLAGGRSKG